jgi:hypothetical protein
MLTSLIIAFFILHGGASAGFASQLDRASKAIKTDVTVDSSKKQALAVIDEATKSNSAFLDQQKKVSEAMSKVLADRGATLAQIDSAVLPLFASDSAAADKMVDASFQLRHVLTAQDWAKVFPAPPAK